MKKVNPKIVIFILIAALLLTILACGTATSNLPTATALPPATETSLPTTTALPLFLSVSLGTTPLKEDGSSPKYSIDAQVPILQGSDDPRVKQFNDEMALLIQQEIGVFKDNVRELAPVPGSNGSSLTEKYTLVSGPGNILSIKFDIMKYIAGAAHPGTYSRTKTYNLEGGADISMQGLFTPGSNYLQVISDYCLLKLKSTIPDLFRAGINPTAANYQSWNISPDGLLITFDEYQVAAYALGPQTVVIPYSELKTVIDPQGPLASFLPK
jgi:hypothetical protein